MARKNNAIQANTPPMFEGFKSPRYTQVPDQLFDELLPALTGAELKVLLYICRRTFGFKKDSDNISINQMLHGIRRKDGTSLDGGAGLSKPTLLRALKSLRAKHIIVAERRQDRNTGNLATNYRLHVQDPLGKKAYQGEGQDLTGAPGSEIDQQQETENQQTEAALVAALSDFGVDKPTVDRLIRSYSSQRIAQKIDYVVFMQEEQPDQVRSPRGWLLKAIENDFGPPAGYQPRANRAAKTSKLQKREEASKEAEVKRRKSQEADRLLKQREAEKLMQKAREEYQTTAKEIELWQEVLDHSRQLAGDTAFALIRQTQLLTTNDGIAIIGTPNPLSASWLRNRLTSHLPAIFERCGCPIETIQVIHLTADKD